MEKLSPVLCCLSPWILSEFSRTIYFESELPTFGRFKIAHSIQSIVMIVTEGHCEWCFMVLRRVYCITVNWLGFRFLKVKFECCHTSLNVTIINMEQWIDNIPNLNWSRFKRKKLLFENVTEIYAHRLMNTLRWCCRHLSGVH